MINESLAIGTFPDCLKRALVVPLHKKDEKDDPNNYRPISLLPCISKIFEKFFTKEYLIFAKKKLVFRKNSLVLERSTLLKTL